jgi:hypothetical protein
VIPMSSVWGRSPHRVRDPNPLGAEVVRHHPARVKLTWAAVRRGGVDNWDGAHEQMRELVPEPRIGARSFDSRHLARGRPVALLPESDRLARRPCTSLIKTDGPAASQRSLQLSQRFKPLRGSSPKAVLQPCDDSGETGARLAPGEMSSSLGHLGCGGLSVEHGRKRPASPAARPAFDQAQLVPVRAGVCGVALSRRRSRSRSSHELARCSRGSDLAECASRASSE